MPMNFGNSGGGNNKFNYGAPNYMDMMQFGNPGTGGGGGVPGGGGGGYGAEAGGGLSPFQNWFGGQAQDGTSTMGYVPAALGTANSLLDGYLGIKQYGMAKDQLKHQKEAFQFQKDAFNKNFESQARVTNANMRDRQQLRHKEHPGMHASPDEYMANYGVQT